MKVWILVSRIAHEDDCVEAVYAQEADAERERCKRNAANTSGYLSYEVEAFEVLE